MDEPRVGRVVNSFEFVSSGHANSNWCSTWVIFFTQLSISLLVMCSSGVVIWV